MELLKDRKEDKAMKEYHCEIHYGWDKSYSRNFDTTKQCKNWLKKKERGFTPSQIICTLIRRN